MLKDVHYSTVWGIKFFVEVMVPNLRCVHIGHVATHPFNKHAETWASLLTSCQVAAC